MSWLFNAPTFSVRGPPEQTNSIRNPVNYFFGSSPVKGRAVPLADSHAPPNADLYMCPPHLVTY
jgi:hypothetical protein